MSLPNVTDPRWIPIEAVYPEFHKDVLTLNRESKQVRVAHLSLHLEVGAQSPVNIWLERTDGVTLPLAPRSYRSIEVTHWMPLP